MATRDGGGSRPSQKPVGQVSRVRRRVGTAMPLRKYVKTGADYAWFVGSSALLLSLPILIELQRETTVMVLQRQRENEMAMMQEQARMMNASAIDNLRATANMMMGSAPAGGAAATADVGR